MKKETELLYVTIKRHRVFSLVKSFLNQARQHYFMKYHNAYLSDEFIDSISSLENNIENLMEELSLMRFEELDILERKHCDIMASVGMNTDTPPFNKSISGKLDSVADINMQHFLSAVWEKGNQDLRQLVIDFMDKRIDFKFDLKINDERGKITHENGMSVYHLPVEVKEYTQKNYTNENILSQAIDLLTKLSHLDHDTVTSKVLAE